MQQNDDSHWNHKWSALALAALLTLFLAFGQYRRSWAVRPPAQPAPPAAPAKPVAAAAKRTARRTTASKNEAASIAAPVPETRGERLRDKGEAFGGDKEQREEADAESAGK